MTAYGINTGITDPNLLGFPRINISPFNYLGGNSSWPLFTAPDTTYQFLDNVTYTRGRHSLRFGGEFRRGGSDYLRASYGRGRVRFSGLEDFIAGTVRQNSFGGGNLLVGDAHRNLSLSAIGGFVQDDGASARGSRSTWEYATTCRSPFKNRMICWLISFPAAASFKSATESTTSIRSTKTIFHQESA